MASCVGATGAALSDTGAVLGGFFITVGTGIAALGAPVLIAFGVGAVACGATTACMYEGGCCGEIKANEDPVAPSKGKRVERGPRRPIRRPTGGRTLKKQRSSAPSKKKATSSKNGTTLVTRGGTKTRKAVV